MFYRQSDLQILSVPSDFLFELREASFLPNNKNITTKQELGQFLLVTWLAGGLFTLLNVIEKAQSDLRILFSGVRRAGSVSPGATFNVALVSDGLQGRPAGQELLQLVSGLLVVGAVHAGGGLHGCRGEMKQDSVVHHSSEHTDRHDEASRELKDRHVCYHVITMGHVGVLETLYLTLLFSVLSHLFHSSLSHVTHYHFLLQLICYVGPEQGVCYRPLPFFESLCSFSLSCFSTPGDSGMSSSMASSDSQA